MTTASEHHLTVVGRSPAGLPRSLGLQVDEATVVARRRAYRRLTAAILRLDVGTLAAELRADRLGRAALPHAA
jgi:hypothetical protein